MLHFLVSEKRHILEKEFAGMVEYKLKCLQENIYPTPTINFLSQIFS